MKYIFSAVITPNEDGTRFFASVPDLSSCTTSGRTLSEAMDMITDAASGCLCVYEDENILVPSPTPQQLLSVPSGSLCTLIRIDTISYRSLTDNRAVRKNVSLPAWMASMADRMGVNCSQVLQEALRSRFGA